MKKYLLLLLVLLFCLNIIGCDKKESIILNVTTPSETTDCIQQKNVTTNATTTKSISKNDYLLYSSLIKKTLQSVRQTVNNKCDFTNEEIQLVYGISSNGQPEMWNFKISSSKTPLVSDLYKKVEKNCSLQVFKTYISKIGLYTFNNRFYLPCSSGEATFDEFEFSDFSLFSQSEYSKTIKVIQHNEPRGINGHEYTKTILYTFENDSLGNTRMVRIEELYNGEIREIYGMW